MKFFILLVLTTFFTSQANARLFSDVMRVAPFELEIHAQDGLTILSAELETSIARDGSDTINEIFYGSSHTETVNGSFDSIKIDLSEDRRMLSIDSKKKLVLRRDKRILTSFGSCNLKLKLKVVDFESKVHNLSFDMATSGRQKTCSNSKDMREILLREGSELNLYLDKAGDRARYGHRDNFYLKP